MARAVIKTTQLGYIVDTDMEINRYYNFVSNERCSTPPYTLDYVARHEFGHYVEFNDVWYGSLILVVPCMVVIIVVDGTV